MDTELQFIHHGEHRVAVLSGNPHAAGTPLIFLHGVAGSIHFWPALLPTSVRDHRRWYSIGLPSHWPGHEPSRFAQVDGSVEQISAEEFAEIHRAVIRQLSPMQPVAVIGYSTGAFAALNLAASAPELVTTVVSVSGFAIGKWHGSLGRLQSLASRGSAGRRACAILWSLMASNSSVFRRLLLLNARKLSPTSRETEALLDRATLDAKRQNPAALANLFANVRRYDIRPLLHKINVPVLIAGGDRDPIIRYEHMCELAADIRGAELVTFRNVGHLFFVECSNLFQKTLEDWIDRNSTLSELRGAA